MIILSHALHDISGLPVTSFEDAKRVIRAIRQTLALTIPKDFQSAILTKADTPWVLAHMDVVTRTASFRSLELLADPDRVRSRFHRHPCRRYISEPHFSTPLGLAQKQPRSTTSPSSLSVQ